LNLSDEDVRKVADLANLRLSSEELARMAHDLGHILTHIEQLNALDTSEVEPMAQVLYEADETATLREDTPHATLSNREALANAISAGAGYYKVPKVIERT
jgi:aspartyl-tRNA(Asn)/glutamyl-tRNA(Gln) amidotransferase subunit C